MFKNTLPPQSGDAALSPVALFIPPVTAGAILGFKKQSTYNQIFKGTFPLALYRIGSRHMVKQADLDCYVCNLKPIELKGRLMASKKIGRPTKANQIARRNLKDGVQA